MRLWSGLVGVGISQSCQACQHMPLLRSQPVSKSTKQNHEPATPGETMDPACVCVRVLTHCPVRCSIHLSVREIETLIKNRVFPIFHFLLSSHHSVIARILLSCFPDGLTDGWLLSLVSLLAGYCLLITSPHRRNTNQRIARITLRSDRQATSVYFC